MEIRRLYELLVLSAPTLSEPEHRALMEDIVRTVQQNGVTVLHQISWGKRLLAYPIRKHREGWYSLFYTAAYPSQLVPVEQWLKLQPQVLRYKFVRVNRAHLAVLKKQI
ncbi:MAG: 30S ribosomal protein S6, partial [Acidobacteria bacterium]|nr:30S ribosomal protein S6 [Acidobacteriota bacterium]